VTGRQPSALVRSSWLAGLTGDPPLVNDEWYYILMHLSTPSYGSHPISINRTNIECIAYGIAGLKTQLPPKGTYTGITLTVATQLQRRQGAHQKGMHSSHALRITAAQAPQTTTLP
jgi:hypothetical protein